MKTALKSIVMIAFVAFLTANAAEQAAPAKQEAPQQATTVTTAKTETVTTQTPAPKAEVVAPPAAKPATAAPAAKEVPADQKAAGGRDWLKISTSGSSGRRDPNAVKPLTKAEVRQNIHNKLVAEYLAASRFTFTPEEMKELGVGEMERKAYAEAYAQHAKAAKPATPAPTAG